MSLTEAELIEKARAGDHLAFTCLVEKHQDMAFSVAFRLLGNNEDAEDVVLECFVRLWRNLSTYRADSKLTTWLYRIITNRCLDLLKSKYRKLQRESFSIDEITLLETTPSPEKEVQNRELLDIVLKLADKLTSKQRMVFVLRDLEGLPVNEVCDILSMSPGNVKSNLYYARQSMNEKLKKYYGETEKRMTL